MKRILASGCRFYGYDSFILTDHGIQPMMEFSPDGLVWWARAVSREPCLSTLVASREHHPL